MKDYTIAHHAYDERTVELRKWCNDNKGRTLALCKRIYSRSTGIHPYKSGKLVITDELWSRIKEEMKYVESHESKVKTPYISVTKTRNIIADGNIYAQAIDGLSKDRGRKAFSEFVGIEVTAENLRSKELRDLIIINYPKYLKALGRGTEYRIKSSILHEEIDKWLLTDESIKRRMFLFIYPLVSKTKITSNALSCILRNLNKYDEVKGYVYQNVKLSMMTINALIQQNDKMVEDVQQIKFNDLLTRFDVDHYNNILKNFEKE